MHDSMRTPAGFTADGDGTSLLSSPPSSSAATGGGSQSAWHSPVPYLFGGLAAMLGLIAVALLILACSYWKLSSYLDSSYLDSGDDDDDGAEDPSADRQKRGGRPAVLEERFLVIMPGDDAPTVLAIPISKATSDASAASSATVTTDRDNGEPSVSAVT